MPCYSVLFNKNCEPEFEFGKHHRNFVTWFDSHFLMSFQGINKIVL